MPLEVKQFNCPQCGSPLSIKNAAGSRSIICPACSSQIDLTGPGYRVVGNAGARRAPRLTQFTLGMTGTLQGEQHEIIGRVVYRDNEGYTWDEWELLSAAGAYRWLSDDEDEGMVLWHGYTPTQPVDPNTVRDGQQINLGGAPAHVTEVTHATIDYLEGELTWKAHKGDTMKALDAAGPGGEMFSVEWTADEIEFYRGTRQDARAVAAAFGVPAAAAAVASGASKAGASLGTVLVATVVIIFLCIAFASAIGGGGFNCRATPAAVRSSSCSSFSFGSGGGSSGGGFGGGGGSGK